MPFTIIETIIALFKWFKKDQVYEKTEPGYNYDARRVKCVETGEVFESTGIAMKLCDAPTIEDVLMGAQKASRGLHFEYTEDKATDTTKTVKIMLSRHSSVLYKIICITTGEKYHSLNEASRMLELDRGLIANVCDGYANQTHGLVFRRLDYEGNVIEPINHMKNNGAKKVKCIEDSLIFSSVHDCAVAYEAPNDNTISRVCRGERKTYKGKHFIYIEEKLNVTK